MVFSLNFMYFKIIINIFLIFALSIFQFSFISGLPAGLSNFNLILVVLIFILSLSGIEPVLWRALGAGLVLDIFSFLPFGVFLFSLSLSFLAANFLLINFFTNRSLYSFLALTAITSIFFDFIFNLINYFFQYIYTDKIFFLFNLGFWKSLAYTEVFNLIAVIIIFYAINFLNKKLKPVFLFKKIIK